MCRYVRPQNVSGQDYISIIRVTAPCLACLGSGAGVHYGEGSMYSLGHEPLDQESASDSSLWDQTLFRAITDTSVPQAFGLDVAVTYELLTCARLSFPSD